jgi:hypothetical protein
MSTGHAILARFQPDALRPSWKRSAASWPFLLITRTGFLHKQIQCLRWQLSSQPLTVSDV